MQANSDVTFKRDETILYINLSKKASAKLAKELDGASTFESICEFLIRHSPEKVPFWEGSMTASAIIKTQTEIKEVVKRSTHEEISIEIIGFKSDPVQIMQGSLDFPDAPKYLNDFDHQAYEEIVNSMLDIMKGNYFVVQVHGK